ncbi:3-deoxy-8-phosphooctulonate synthase [bacterium]|nr:3-deoxy-8-phosphooctulonate synthase [bacterium]
MGRNPVEIGGVRFGRGARLAFIAGPCVIEDASVVLETAHELKSISERLGVGLVFKASYLKDNRMSPDSYAGPGATEGLALLERVRAETGLPVMSDVHTIEEVAPAAAALDALQIPAFLCRQSRLMAAAASAGLPLNIKKGQFLAPEDMRSVAAKAEAAGNEQLLLTERGVTFGYHNLIVDMRAFEILGAMGHPVIFDATHSVQLPGAGAGVSGGQPEFVPVLMRAACAAGCDGVFIETHPSPADALSDAASMIPLSEFEALAVQALAIADAARPYTNAGRSATGSAT